MSNGEPLHGSRSERVYDQGTAGGHDQRPLGTLLKDLTGDVSNLVRGEVELAKAEVKEGAVKFAQGAVEVIGGLLIGFVALIILLQALVVALANIMPDWLAAVIVGGVVALIALFMVIKGQSDLRNASLLPRRATQHAKADVQMAKEHV